MAVRHELARCMWARGTAASFWFLPAAPDVICTDAVLDQNLGGCQIRSPTCLFHVEYKLGRRTKKKCAARWLRPVFLTGFQVRIIPLFWIPCRSSSEEY